ncbi:CCT2 [Symbiodinium sp. KB8]|nr:CCT2 [Symbiodinium sp. KB8]
MQRVKARGDKPVRIYADGVFDLFHHGHARALQQAKTMFPNTTLIVGCCSDALTHSYKGQTVLLDTERYAALSHCAHVDEVVENAPWVLTPAFLDEHDIDFVCHDAAPYTDTSGASGDSGDIYGELKRMGRFLETQRTPSVSTTDIIVRVIQRYNEYIARNMARGVSLEAMKVPTLNRLTFAAAQAQSTARSALQSASDEVEKVSQAALTWLTRAMQRLGGGEGATDAGSAATAAAERATDGAVHARAAKAARR